MSILEMKVPSPGKSISEVEIAVWLVSDGDYVEKDQAIAEIDSDKATLELSAEASGTITLKVAEGDVIMVGQVVCEINTDTQKPAGNPVPKIEVNSEETKSTITPFAETKTMVPNLASSKIMNENGISSNQVAGTEKDGRITKQDVVNSDVKLIEHVFLKLIDLKDDCSKRITNLEINFNNELKAFETSRSNLKSEKNNALTKEDFIFEAINLAKSEYNKVRIYIWVTFALSIGLLVLNFYNNGINFSHYVKFLLFLIAITYFSGKSMGEHITALSRIKKLSECVKNPPPFYYKWFGKRTLQEFANELSNKYLTETKAKYDKLVYDAETEINIKIKQLKEAKVQELKLIDEELKNILNSYLNKVNSAMNRLGKIAQTCSNRINLIGFDNKTLPIQKVYSHLYYFSHFEQIQISNASYSFPNYFQFGNNMNVHLEKNGNDKIKIKSILRDIILRNLLGLNFSKLKLTMYDPVELGAFFSDYHQLNKEITGGFVYHTIDELNEILDSTLRHISMIVQKILTNKYQTLDDFNENNTELAEPFRLLIINDFPRSFDDHQLGKIKQILTSGPKCGVYTIIIGSISQLGLNPINSLNVAKINPILNEIKIDDIIEIINQGTTAAGTVTVDLNTILLNETNWWTNDSSTSISLPLGKKGKEIQSLTFDNKDDNQALMIGKPGSGKSNLLHVIILSAITKYGPSDLEIFLIDFKGGVEFMSYAEYAIPQLRTVALESDREFGLSVIDGVDKELMRRETLFRNSGVQNIEQYNQKNPNQKIPRILFIVDEFQEFFKIEDEIKEQVSLKYDNIIRKGRAFGINSLFSSQTLDGHSIPRSTKELIDIRIALMCGDNDVREIMDDKNLAAKDLSRPGEAIYNAENGKTNGNQRFQAVFVERNDINEIISKVSDKSLNGYIIKDRFIFRGDLLAKITKENHPINNPENLKYKALRLWIGEPVSMDPDYFIDIKQVSSQNLLSVGNNHESAALFSSMIYSLKKQQNKINKLFIINPLTDVDEGFEDFNKSYGESDLITFYKLSQLDELFDELSDIIEQRKIENKNEGNVIFILNSINKIARLREDNLECVMDKLYKIIYEGPELGVYSFLHCDSVNSLKRTNLNSYLSLFNHRILYNMSQDGFYDIIGNNSIKNLKPNRLVYYTDELGKYQIIKPYELTIN